MQGSVPAVIRIFPAIGSALGNRGSVAPGRRSRTIALRPLVRGRISLYACQAWPGNLQRVGRLWHNQRIPLVKIFNCVGGLNHKLAAVFSILPTVVSILASKCDLKGLLITHHEIGQICAGGKMPHGSERMVFMGCSECIKT